MMILPKPRRIALDSGAILLYQRNVVSPATAFGVWIRKGSRDESTDERGMSHVLEHMVFRGTQSRSGLDIAFDLESVGGHWDAFTSKESVCYHGMALDEHFPRLAGIFSDIVLDPLIDPSALKTELKVISEEIRSVKDSPEETAYELFYRRLFNGDQLGYPVAGSLKDISRIEREDLLAFHRKTYTAANTIFAYTGSRPPARVARMLEKTFRFPLKGRRPARRRASFGDPVSWSVGKREWGQYHVCTGSRTVPADDPERFAVMLLSGILGGGVSSRMFQSMRDRTGLAYSVYSNVVFWSDTGALSVYFSVDPRNLRPALDIFEREIEDVRSGGVTEEELASAKAQLKASIIFGLESAETRLFRLFNEECYGGGFRRVEEVLADVERIDRESVGRAARRFLSPESVIRVICGPAVPAAAKAGARRRSG